MSRYLQLEVLEQRVKDYALAEAVKYSADPVEFIEKLIGFKLFVYQVKLVRDFQKSQFIAARWCRQSGKSWIVSALLLWYAVTFPESYIGVVGPSWRQTKRIIGRIAFFARRLPPALVFRPHKTYLHFPNGSMIEAFPNSPETIRGPTLNVVYCDEMNFIPSDVELYDAVLFTLGTTDGKFVCTSTPWNTDSVFWKIFNDKNFDHYVRSHVTLDQALAPNGPLKPNMIEEIRKQFGDDPSRWRREMMAEWAEDEDTWLSQSLIASCNGTVRNECGQDLHEFSDELSYEGEFFAGLDLAQTRDYCVMAIVERLNDILLLRHIKIFKQPTLYSTVLSYIKTLQDRWGGFQKIRVDITREGPSFIADMSDSGIDNAEGVIFTDTRKSEMAHLLRSRMNSHRFFYPNLKWEKPYQGDLSVELNVERYDLRKNGTYGFSHPNGTHDDVFWALALAVYATAEMVPEPIIAVVER